MRRFQFNLGEIRFNVMTFKYANGFTITTPADALEAMKPHRDILLPDGRSLVDVYTDAEGIYTPPEKDVMDTCTLCGVAVHKRGDLLTKDEVNRLNEWAAANVVQGSLELSGDVVKALLRLVEVDPTQSPSLIKLGDKHYRSLSNATNRAMVKSRLGSSTSPGYVYDMVQGRWVWADPFIVDALAMAASLQHRCSARLYAQEEVPELPPVTVPIMLGLPPQFVDFIDRGKSRTPQDREYRDTSNFDDSLLEECLEEVPDGLTLPRLRNQWSRTLVAVSNNLFSRLSGTNVHPGKKQQPSEGHRVRLQQLWGDGKEVQRVILWTYAASRGEDGKALPWTKVYSQTMVTTAILLMATRGYEPIDNVVATIDNPDSGGMFPVQEDDVRGVLDALADSCGDPCTGPFGPALEDVIKATKAVVSAGGTKPNEPELFQTLVKAIGQWEKEGVTEKVWLGKRDRKKAEKLKTWLTFGGADRGPIEKE